MNVINSDGLEFNPVNRVLSVESTAMVGIHELILSSSNPTTADPFDLTLVARPMMPPATPTTVTITEVMMVDTGTVIREDDDNDFEKFAGGTAAAAIAIIVYKTAIAPKFGSKIKFTAMPTSNKSLQYNLSADLNKNWSANFTVDKQVKINSETNNSNLYELKFEYKF